ncbi:MAG: diacylglycerol kinase family protein [Bacteroides sp.]|nr:diacylglycerol kinase family protein [Bacteroides sp.]
MTSKSDKPFSWRARGRSFVYAWRGIRYLFRGEHNARIHLCVAAAVVIAGLIFGLSTTEWGVISLAIGLILALEAVNSAVEALADHVSPDFAPLIGRAKDVAAGGVLLGVFGAVGAGIAIFLPKIIDLLF